MHSHIKYITLLVIFVLSCETQKNPTQNTEEIIPINQPVEKKWTFLFYDDADFIASEGGEIYDPLNSFSRMVKSSDKANFLILQDRNDDKAKIWYVDSTYGELVLKKKLGEINMGGTTALGDFISYAKDKYPAERYILSIYDHGGGLWGSCRDDTNGDPSMTMAEMKKNLRNSGGVDIIQFSAPCLMGALESVYELRDYVDVYIGSEDNSGYAFWSSTMRDISNELDTNPDIDTRDLSEVIIKSINNRNPPAKQYSNMLTMSAIETSKMQTLVDELDEIAEAYLEQRTKFASMMDSLKHNITFIKQKYMDVYDFAYQFSLNETDQKILQKLEKFKTAFNEAIIAEVHGNDWPNAHGLTVYFPLDDIIGAHSFYTSPDYRLDFVHNTNWDDLIHEYGAFTKGKISSEEFIPWIPKGDGYSYPFD